MQSCLGEIRILNRRAWTSRWRCRRVSREAAARALALSNGQSGADYKVAAGMANRTLSWQAKWRGDFDDAMSYALAGEAFLDERSFPIERADIYSILGVLHYSRARIDLASSACERGFAILPDCDPKALATRLDLLTTKATIQRYRGQLAHSNVTLGAAIECAERDELARVEHNVARCLLADNAAEEALEHAARSIDLCHEFENRVVLPYAFEVHGDCLWRVGEYDAAERQFAEGLEVAICDNDRRAQCQILQKHGMLEMRKGDPRRALDLFRHGAQIARRMTYGLWQKDLALNIAEAHEKLGEFEEALAAHKQAWKAAGEWRS